MGRWSISFRSGDFNGDDRRSRPKRGRQQVPDLTPQAGGEGQHPCPRGSLCASSTRDAEGTWHPLMVNSAFCPADESAIANALPDLPRSYFLLAARIGDPVRSGRGVRRPPGSRVLIDAEADALLRTSAAILMGWASRVRHVPGLQLSPNRHLPDKPEGVRDNCGVLARHVTQLLALPPGPVVRTWTWRPGWGNGRPAAVPCLRCGLPVSPSPSGKRWWPAVCAHSLSVVAAYAENKDGAMIPTAWACAACSKRLPPNRRPAPHCDHEAAPPEAWRPADDYAEVEEEIGDLEIVHAGDGWATVVTELSGVDAGLDVLDLAARFRRHLRESPARPEPLHGIPCRNCPKMSALVRADPPSDPSSKAMHSRCTECGDVMDREEYDDWVRQWNAYAKGGGKPPTCRLCEIDKCRECSWAACGCSKPGHRAA